MNNFKAKRDLTGKSMLRCAKCKNLVTELISNAKYPNAVCFKCFDPRKK